MAFDVLDFVTGASYPKETVHVYLKGEEAAQVSELNGKVNRLNTQIEDLKEQGKSTKTLASKRNKIQDEIDRLRESIKGGTVTFHLQGFPEHVRTTLLKQLTEKAEEEGWDDDTQNLEYLYLIVSATTRKVVGPDGEADTKEMTADRVRELIKVLPQGGADELVEAAYRLAHKSVKFEAETTDSF